MKDKIDLEIHAERERQDRIWGQQNHNPHIYGSILFEECGEVSKAINDSFDFANKDYFSTHDIRAELIQVAAVAKAFIECIDREKWRQEF